GEYIGGISGTMVCVNNRYISVNVKANSGEIWIPVCSVDEQVQPIEIKVEEKQVKVENIQMPVEITESAKEEVLAQTEKTIGQKVNKFFEEMTVEELQDAILERMKCNGPVTEQMKKDVLENIYHNSLVTWMKSLNLRSRNR
ncbi:MAG: alpha-amylase, partial [Clostridia bacterium]|nr:alpha-amylase [Clostridia bacterium]